MGREQILTDTFVELVDTLVDDFDVADVLTQLSHRAVELLWADAAGVLLARPNGALAVVASSSEESRMVEVFELQSDEGPCLECYRSGVAVIDAEVDEGRWPRFAPVARNLGFASVSAVPLRYRSEIIGALNLFGTDRTLAPAEDVRLARALADVATISVLQNRAAVEADEIVAQLNAALESRVAIEQAKGVLAESGNLSMGEAFAVLRRCARSNNRRLADVSHAVADRSLSPTQLLDPRRPR